MCSSGLQINIHVCLKGWSKRERAESESRVRERLLHAKCFTDCAKAVCARDSLSVRLFQLLLLLVGSTWPQCASIGMQAQRVIVARMRHFIENDDDDDDDERAKSVSESRLKLRSAKFVVLLLLLLANNMRAASGSQCRLSFIVCVVCVCVGCTKCAHLARLPSLPPVQ